MAKKPKGEKIHVYFRTTDKKLYDDIVLEAEERGLSPSQVLIGRLYLSMSNHYEDNMLCEKCKCQLEV